MSSNFNKNTFTKITDEPLTLNFSGCTCICDIHRELKIKFGLPDYYGENWDALWDCLDDLFIGSNPITIKIQGLSSLNTDLRLYCDTMLNIFNDICEKCPQIAFETVN